MRGLDYYNKTVFEFVSDQLGAQNAFCAGGRYDYLSQALGEKEAVPALGAAFGIERILMMLEPHQDKLAVEQAPPLQVIIPVGPAQLTLALLCADELYARATMCAAK